LCSVSRKTQSNELIVLENQKSQEKNEAEQIELVPGEQSMSAYE